MEYLKKQKKSLLLIAVCTIALVSGLYFSYAYISKDTWPFTQTIVNPTESVDEIEQYDPPTEHEIEHSQDAKKAEPKSDTPITEVSVIISYAGKSDTGQNLEVSAFTPDVVEENGVCTATLSKGDLSVTNEASAIFDARSTICSLIIPLDDVAPGTWHLTVTYTSEGKTGTSSSLEVAI